MKSLHQRLDHQKDAVLSVTEKFGRFKAMDEFRVRDYPGFVKWLKEVTGDENFGIRPKISLNGHQTLGDQLVSAFLHKVAVLEAQNQNLGERIRFLEWQLERTGEKEQNQALAILEVCEA